ncbi:MAG: adenylate cyclase [Treponematales bacterium]
MRIRVRIFLVVLPIVIVPLFLAGLASYFAAVDGVTKIAQQFLAFKSGELEKYAESQWALLLDNGFASRPDMVEAAKSAVAGYAGTVTRSGTEVIFALDAAGSAASPAGGVVMSTSPLELAAGEREALLAVLEEEPEGMTEAVIGGKRRVFMAFYFAPFQWYVLVSEESAAFYRDAGRIRLQTFIVLAASSAAAILLLFLFSLHITNPLARVAAAMKAIIEGGELSSRVEVELRDETGKLAHTFNLMLGELEKAYREIKRFAFDAVIAGRKEQRIREIFQKYVPTDVIDESFKNPEHMLPGRNMAMSILFSDIRGFTTISEAIGDPKDMVDSLNRYFSSQVDIIYQRGGVVDKYIGDAIMAFWGAPVRHDDDALQSVLAALEMTEALALFNETQRRLGKPEFKIGVGINYGTVTVGNIGSERKRDYTVIGDMVNLASRMEGLTKTYRAELLITETVYEELEAARGNAPPLFFRHLDNVKVKGKTRGVRMYTVRKSLTPEEERAWRLHNEGMELYYPGRAFAEAGAKFRAALDLLPGDFNAALLAERCAACEAAPPPADWDGAEVMQSK